MLIASLVAVAPAVLAASLAPTRWTMFAAAGSAVGTMVLAMGGMACARRLATVESSERQLKSAAKTFEDRIATLEAKSREAASQDEVAGTLNRRTFLRRLDESLQRDARLQKPMAFLLVDIDGFKKINGEAGRVIGDRVLRTVGHAIQASTRGTDFVGRVGGDEFAVVLGECLDPRPAVDRIFVALHGETTGGDKPLPIRVSVGTVTVADAREKVDPVELFRVAEDALASVRGTGQSLCGRRTYGAAAGAARPQLGEVTSGRPGR
jgi:diguanylate cyclase (GGDEF)-like protein